MASCIFPPRASSFLTLKTPNTFLPLPLDHKLRAKLMKGLHVQPCAGQWVGRREMQKMQSLPSGCSRPSSTDCCNLKGPFHCPTLTEPPQRTDSLHDSQLMKLGAGKAGAGTGAGTHSGRGRGTHRSTSNQLCGREQKISYVTYLSFIFWSLSDSRIH